LEDIIAELRKHPGLVKDKVRGAFLINIDAIDQELKESLSSLNKEVTNGLKGVSMLRAAVGVVTAVIGLSVIAGGLYSGYKISELNADLQKKDTELAALKAKADLLVKEQRTFTEIDTRHTTRRVLRELTDLLDGFSMINENKALIDDLAEVHSTLVDFDRARAESKNDRSAVSSDLDNATLLIDSLLNAVLNLEALKSVSAKMERLTKIKQVAAQWGAITISKNLPPEFADFTAHFEAYRENVLGVLAYKRAKEINSGQRALLDEADEHFLKSSQDLRQSRRLEIVSRPRRRI